MNLTKSIKHVYGNYAKFGGRATRSEYWYFLLFQILGYAAIGIIGLFSSATVYIVLTVLFSLFNIIPGLAVSVRRLHDTGKGGGWIFINAVPLIGGIWYLVLMLTKSEDDNRFGTDPLATEI